MSLNREEILNDLIDSYSNYTNTVSGVKAEKVLKFSGIRFDLSRRKDIKTEVIVFQFLNGDFYDFVDDEKPDKLSQRMRALAFVEQADRHSTVDVRYQRLLNLSDDLVNWMRSTAGVSINDAIYTIEAKDFTPVDEDQGFLSLELNFELKIQL